MKACCFIIVSLFLFTTSHHVLSGEVVEADYIGFWRADVSDPSVTLQIDTSMTGFFVIRPAFKQSMTYRFDKKDVELDGVNLKIKMHTTDYSVSSMLLTLHLLAWKVSEQVTLTGSLWISSGPYGPSPSVIPVTFKRDD